LKTARRVRIVLRALAVPVGLFGAFMAFGALLMAAMSIKASFMLAFVLFGACISAYLLYTAYLVWFRYSAGAVRHLCAVYSFASMYVTYKFFPLFSPSLSKDFPFALLLPLVPFVAMLVLYKVSVWSLLKTGVAAAGRQ